MNGMGDSSDFGPAGERIWMVGINNHLRLEEAMQAGVVYLRGRYDKTELFAFEVEWETYTGGTTKTWELSALLQYNAMYKDYVKAHGIRPHPGDFTMEDNGDESEQEVSDESEQEISDESGTEGDSEYNSESGESEGHEST